MESRPPFRLLEPARLSSSAVFNSPHSGRDYPDELVGRSRLTREGLRASEDVLVDELFAAAPGHGAPLLAATAPRAWLDLNRSPAELDPALIRGVRLRDATLNQRVAAGLGVIPRVVAEGAEIYRTRIALAEAEARIRTVHAPYHAQLESLLVRARDAFGMAVLFDCHSMPSEALRAAPRVDGRCPDVVLGDRFGAAAGRALVLVTQRAFERQGFTVVRNAPFAGGYITQRYGRPALGLHAIQIEIDRGVYLDQVRLEPLAGFAEVRERIGRVVSELAGIASGVAGLAAE
ncbi:MAG TPA: N-formylglutamate amidohydrolase [Thermohalobaculum sp.]|nr:N-formylglutamate amidohydrolase [Thermohalobaculum sp.]